MYIANLRYPGTWIEGPDSFEVGTLVHTAESLLTQAAVAAFYFDVSMSEIVRKGPDLEQREIWGRRRAELFAQLDTSGQAVDLAAVERLDETIRREQLASGVIPPSYVAATPRCYAHTFLYATDMLAKVFNKISKLRALDAIDDAMKTFAEAFPNLREVRNSVQHLEERVQGLRGTKRIQPKPIDSPNIHSDGGAMVADQLDDNRFAATMGDGEYGQVEVSLAKLTIATRCLQAIIDALSWSGAPHVSPHFVG